MEETPHDYRDVLNQNEEQYMDYRGGIVDRNVMTAPKNVRRNYITADHDKEDADRTTEAAQEVLSELGN